MTDVLDIISAMTRKHLLAVGYTEVWQWRSKGIVSRIILRDRKTERGLVKKDSRPEIGEENSSNA